MPDLFITYSRRDKDFVQKLHTALVHAKRDVWIDWEDIPPTTEWWKQIQQGIEAATSYIYVLSPSSVQSKVCRQEVEHAVANNKRIVPIVFIEIKDPADFEKIHPAVSAHNWIFFTDPTKFDESFQTLLEALDTDYAYVQEHTRLLVKAHDWQRGLKDTDYLLRGDELEAAQVWMAEGAMKKPPPASLHVDYIIASQKAQSAFERVRFLALSAGLIITLIFLALSVVGFNQASNEADRRATSEINERDSARTAQTAQAVAENRAAEIRSLALADASGDALANDNVDIAILLALEANNVRSLPEAQRALAAASYHPGARRQFRASNAVNDVVVNASGTIAYSAGRDGRLTSWEIATGRKLREAQLSLFRITTLGLRADGQLIAAGLGNGEVVLWDTTTQQEVARWQAHTGSVASVAFSLDGDEVLSAGREGFIILWDATSHVEIRRFEGHDGSIANAVFSPDGTLILSGGALDRRLILWNAVDGRIVGTTETPIHDAAINEVAFSPDGTMVLSASEDTTIRLFTLRLFNEVVFEPRTTFRREFAVKTAVFSPDGRTVVAGSVFPDQSLTVWDVATGNEIDRLTAHTNTINAVAFLPNSLQVLSASEDVTLILWDIENGALLQRFSEHDGAVNTAAFSPNDTQILSAGRDDRLILWDMQTRQVVRTFEGHTDDVNSVVINADGTRAASGSDDSTIIIWDMATGTPVFAPLTLNGPVNSVAFSPDGRVLVAGSQDLTVSIWDATNGNLVRTLQGHARPVNAVAFSADGRTIVSGARDGRMILWDAQTGNRLGADFTASNGSVIGLAFSPDGQRIASAAFRTVTLWDVTTRTIVRTYEGHRSIVNGVVFSPDGRTIVSGASDALVILWDVETGEAILSLEGHRGGVNGVAFNWAGNRAVSASNDGTLILWRIDSLDSLITWTLGNRLIREFTCLERQTFRLSPCDANGTFPTSTPFATPTLALPTLTVVPPSAVTPTP